MAGENGNCKAHSGIVTEITNLKESDNDQWDKINAITNRSIATLTATIMTLIGVVASIGILISRW